MDAPNVVVVLTDQQRWDTVGANGCPLDLTPNLDGLAREGVRFAKAFTCQPVCAPARACLQTGKYATENGVFRNGIPLPPAEHPVLGRILPGLQAGAGSMRPRTGCSAMAFPFRRRSAPWRTASR